MTRARGKKELRGSTEPDSTPTATQVDAYPGFLKLCRLSRIDTVAAELGRRHLNAPLGPLPEVTAVPSFALRVRKPQPPPLGGAAFLVDAVVTWGASAEACLQGDVASTADAEAYISLTLRVLYDFPDLPSAPDAALVERLGNEAAVHHAWPFVRERLLTMSTSLGLAPFVLPLRHR
jgi:hypothetical protein